MQLRKHFYQATRLVAGLLVVVLAMTGAAKLADQIVTWLAFAVWQPFTIADALRFWDLPLPHAPESLGLREITDAILSWPGVPAYFLLAGACLCGAIRYEVEGPLPAPIHCHCSRCRKHHGAPFATSVELAPNAFHWLAGETC